MKPLQVIKMINLSLAMLGAACSRPAAQAPNEVSQLQLCRNDEGDAEWVYQRTSRTSDFEKLQAIRARCSQLAAAEKRDAETSSGEAAGNAVSAAFGALAAGARGAAEASRSAPSNDGQFCSANIRCPYGYACVPDYPGSSYGTCAQMGR